MYIKLIIAALATSLLLTTQTTQAQTYANYLCNTGIFDCYKVKRGESWESLFPDFYQRQLVKNLNRINTRLYAGRKIAVPYDLGYVDRLDLAPFPPMRETEGRKVVIVDPNQLAWGAYDEAGVLVNWGAASAGKSWCPDVGEPCRTVTGDYTMIRKQGPECESSKYPIETDGGAPMPYCMHFYRGFAIHGSDTVPGYNASHGCVRVLTEDAEWLNTQFIDLPDSGRQPTKVIVIPYS